MLTLGPLEMGESCLRKLMKLYSGVMCGEVWICVFDGLKELQISGPDSTKMKTK